MEKLIWSYASLKDAENDGAIVSFKGKYRFFSNFFPHPVPMYGVTFPTVEHAFMAAKLDNAHLHDAKEHLMRFARMKSPADAKKEGRRLTLRADWEKPHKDGLLYKEWVMLTLLRRKFSAPAMKEKLLATQDKLLLEGNTWGDRVWGVIDTKAGIEGYNRLGGMLMAVRAELGGAPIPSLVPSYIPTFIGKGL